MPASLVSTGASRDTRSLLNEGFDHSVEGNDSGITPQVIPTSSTANGEEVKNVCKRSKISSLFQGLFSLLFKRERERESCAAGARGDKGGVRGFWCGGGLLLLLLVGLGCVVPGVAGAAFERGFVQGLSSGNGVGLVPGGLAVDGEDGLWVEDAEDSLVGFKAAYSPGDNGFLEVLPGFSGVDVLQQLAVEDTSEDFYVAGDSHGQSAGTIEVYDRSGTRLREWGSFSNPSIAVDDAPMGSLEDPSACGSLPLAAGECFVYVGQREHGGGVEKFSPKGTPEAFSYAEECEKTDCGYVSGGEITNIPGGRPEVWGETGPDGVAVDPKGDIFIGDLPTKAVYEYRASGQFVQSFNLQSEEVPPAETITAVAVDPVSGHLLVAVTREEGSGGRLGAIDEFDPATGKFVAQIDSAGETEAGEPVLLERPASLAVDSHGDVYVLDRRGETGSGEVIDVYGPGAFVPTLVLNPASERKPASAVLNGTVNPEGLELTECRFEYVAEEAFLKTGFATAKAAECEPAAGAIAHDHTAHTVRAAATVTAGVTYRYRLLAHSAGVLGGSSQTQPLAFTAPSAPKITGISTGETSSSFAELHAEISPQGAATTYQFQYLPVAAYVAGGESFAGARSVPAVAAGIGSGGATGAMPASVAQPVSGLTGETEYEYRVVAVNECEALEHPGRQCETVSNPAVLTTLPEPSVGLPDHRAYELVTPADKEGGSDMFAEPTVDGQFLNSRDVGVPSLQGDGFLLETKSAFGGFPSAGSSVYAFKRDPATGWEYVSLASPTLGVQSLNDGIVYDPWDFSTVAFTDLVGAAIGASGAQTTSLVGAPGGGYETLHTDPVIHGRTIPDETEVVAGSQNLSRVVLEAGTGFAEGGKLCGPGHAAEAVEEGDVLCEWTGSFETNEGGEEVPALRLVSFAPGSETKPASSCGAQLGNGIAVTHGGAYRAVSADGSRVFFTAPQVYGQNGVGLLSGAGCWNGVETGGGGPVHAPQLFVRVGGLVTLRVSEVEAGVREAGSKEPGERPVMYPAYFAGASEDGSRVFFATRTELTHEAAALGLHDMELYECRLVEEEAGAPACVLARVSAGEAGSVARQAGKGAGVDRVFTVSADGSAVYFDATAALTPGESATGGVFRYDTSTGATSFVAGGGGYERRAYTQDECPLVDIAPCSYTNWYTTPDGRFLLFVSSTTGELERFDAQAREHGEPSLVCVVCVAGGGLVGEDQFDRSGVGWPAAGPVAGMSDNGAFVFFDAPARLVPDADNGTLDVYEWEERGVGGCGLARGCVRLISSPNDSSPSYFLGYSPYYLPGGGKVEGGNVFFGTHAQLVPQDTNTVGNIYDARICEAQSPCLGPPTPLTVQCEGGACQTPPAAPQDTTPSSMTFKGPGNTPSSPPAGSPPLTVAQRLAAALKVCRKEKKHAKRVACEKRARTRFKAKKGQAGKARKAQVVGSGAERALAGRAAGVGMVARRGGR